jgi:hypothetical protein
MTISSVGSTQSPALSGVVVLQRIHHKRAPNELATTIPASSTPSIDGANQLASAVAAALTQLGLTSSANSISKAAAANTPLAPLPQQPKAAQQVEQYRNIASTFSNLAQALSTGSGSTSVTSNSSGSSGLTTVFQNLWTSLGASDGTSTDASTGTLPSLPSFLQTLAHNISESDISGLRGVFVDTLA